ncbi:flagellar basal body P-ring formation chaperone FlgA [soil metagenome]
MLQIHLLCLLLCALVCAPAAAQGVDAAVLAQVQQMALAGATVGAPAQAKVDVQVGALDPRLRLAPCKQIQPYLPAGLQMWGHTRIGLRCLDIQSGGVGRWNVSVPVTVKVYGRALVAAASLPAGTILTQAHLATAEIDIAAEAGGVFTDAAALAGRTLSRPIAAGEALRSRALNKRQWFAAGDLVNVRASGAGFAVAGEGQAVSAGLEGQDVKVRFENGRVVTGRAVGERRVEIVL